MSTPAEGETYTHERTFTVADVRQFSEGTGDAQDRHTVPDEDGRVLVQGLLTGSLLTKIGGDLEVLATRMELHFRRPVYSGDTVRCTWTNERVTDRADGVEIEASVVCRRVDGDEGATPATGTPGEEATGEIVLGATVEGVVYE
ncbi:dehydratase [Halobacteriales archaeon SW_10_68_16]|nr:MAG: dehydratase [Halobacteriales archaeon SW_10_68_16]